MPPDDSVNAAAGAIIAIDHVNPTGTFLPFTLMCPDRDQLIRLSTDTASIEPEFLLWAVGSAGVQRWLRDPSRATPIAGQECPRLDASE